MIEQLKQYPKHFAEFVEWLCNKPCYVCPNTNYYFGDTFFNEDENGKTYKVSHRELTSLLVEWLDSKGICISSYPYHVCLNGKIGMAFGIQIVMLNGVRVPLNEDYILRQEATEAGIKRAFELLEEK